MYPERVFHHIAKTLLLNAQIHHSACPAWPRAYPDKCGVPPLPFSLSLRWGNLLSVSIVSTSLPAMCSLYTGGSSMQALTLRASFFAASDENHRPLSAASNSDQLEEQALAQMKSYSRLLHVFPLEDWVLYGIPLRMYGLARNQETFGSLNSGRGECGKKSFQSLSHRTLGKDSSPTLASKVDQLEGMLKMLREDLKKEKEDKAHLQAEVQHLREDNLRLQEESQNASDKLKKFTEWVFNTIDMS
ncbi:Signal-induced proliferation-associated 1-like protein 1 [Saguinus oedipus]|uniref:Signal-induced proliferation-associated 1-like protein 1 n=1 Tax=Saguinus oedipus TaxID=9490 RepID=A0ABQ9V4Y0_SAGOE|nr:Signal-induced proliferation-associated 1-like protein 1 [Saguinus oedipus]